MHLTTVVAPPYSGLKIVHWPVPLRDESQREGLADQRDASPSGRATAGGPADPTRMYHPAGSDGQSRFHPRDRAFSGRALALGG